MVSEGARPFHCLPQPYTLRDVRGIVIDFMAKAGRPRMEKVSAAGAVLTALADRHPCPRFRPAIE